MNSNSYLSRVMTVVCLAALWCVPSFAVAQDGGEDAEEQAGAGEEADEQEQKNGVGEDGYVTPTDKQTALNTAAVEAIKNEEYEQAVKLLRRSLELGEMNITYLNLGRAHQRLDECGAAEAAYLEALSAPPVRNPSAFLVEKKVEQYLQELEDECEEGDWEKTTSGDEGSGNYTWESEQDESAPMMRVGLGVATSSFGAFPAQGQLSSSMGDVANLSYNGAALRVELLGGYFLNDSVAIHAGMVVNYLPAPTNYIEFHDISQEDVSRDNSDGVNSAGFTGLTVGATGYIPGDVFLSGGFGLGLGAVDDDGLDLVVGTGWELNLLLGKDFEITDQFALGLGAYLDIANQPTDAGFRMYGLALGLQTHGTIRFR
jgi:tetratricopeptide (TPR) repeat protein